MQIPLFPLHTVLAPGIALPLHVFEDRYRHLVRTCLDAPSPFGVVLIRDGREVAPGQGGRVELSIAAVGTFAEIREASRYADGRYDLLAVGVARFVVREVHTDLAPYLVADVEPFPDEPGGPAERDTDRLAGRVTRRFVDYLRLLQPRDGETAEPIDVQMEVETEVDDELEIDASDLTGSSDGEPLPVDDPEATSAALRIPDDPSALSYLLTGIVQVEQDRKQDLLEAPSAGERLHGLDTLLDRELMLLGARLAPYVVDRRALVVSGN